MEINHTGFDEGVVLQVGKFAILWNDFENRYTKNGDYSLLKPLCSEIKCSNYEACEKLRIFLYNKRSGSSNENDFIQKYLYTDKSNKKVKDDDKNNINAFLDTPIKGDISNAQLYGCILVIKRFRDNIMHGIKQWAILSAQHSIIDAINQILESIEKK